MQILTHMLHMKHQSINSRSVDLIFSLRTQTAKPRNLRVLSQFSFFYYFLFFGIIHAYHYLDEQGAARGHKILVGGQLSGVREESS
jgi:hypothetical protein